MPDANPPIVDELNPDLDAWEVARRFAGWPGMLILDSADRASPFGRYSYVMAGPRDGIRWSACDSGDPFAAVAQLLTRRQAPALPDLPPFQGGAAGLFGYGLGRAIERMPIPEFDEFQTPDLAVNVYDWVIGFDHERRRSWLISHAGPQVTWEVAAALQNPSEYEAHSPVPPSSRHPVIPSSCARGPSGRLQQLQPHGV